jgi:ubiquinone/menaquinone biosynthesis C-methylase UbiE
MPSARNRAVNVDVLETCFAWVPVGVKGADIFIIPTPPHSSAKEYLDAPGSYAAELSGNLRDIRRLNAWFGGTRLAVTEVQRVLSGKQSARVLDVATGSGDIPMALSGWGKSQGIDLEIVGADLSPQVISEARRYVAGSDVRLARADARRLPWNDGTFDLVCSCLALHHFESDEAMQVLREMWRVTSDAVVVIDLVRSYLGYIGTWAATRTVATNVLTRHDGPLSVLRAYTPREMSNLAQAAGILPVEVRTRPLFRQVLIGRKGGEHQQ